MIRREHDAKLINEVSNMPGVREFVCFHSGRMNWSEAFPARRTGIAVLSDGNQAVGVFGLTGERIWQAHTMFGPDCRGRQAINTAKEMLDWIRPYADMVWGATPIDNRAARWFNRQLGAVPVCRDRYDAEGEVEIFEIRM